MQRYDPLFTPKEKPVTASTQSFVVSASIGRNYTPPISPMSKKPMVASYAIIDGRRVNMYMDMDNRIAYPANIDDVL